jgi:hypothetical protein
MLCLRKLLVSQIRLISLMLYTFVTEDADTVIKTEGPQVSAHHVDPVIRDGAKTICPLIRGSLMF